MLSPIQPQHAFAQVLIQLEAKALDKRTFTYAIPPALAPDIQVGVAVLVPFGRLPAVPGFVVGFAEKAPQGYAVKALSDVLDSTPLFDLDFLALMDWLATTYATPLIQVLLSALPAELLQKRQRFWALTDTGLLHFSDTQPNSQTNSRALTLPEKKLLPVLHTLTQPATANSLAKRARLPVKIVQGLLTQYRQKGWLSVHDSVRQAAQAKTQLFTFLQTSPDQINALQTKPVTATQQAIIDYLSTHQLSQPGLPEKGLPLAELLKACKTTAPTVKRLANLGWLRLENRAVVRNPLDVFAHENQQQPFMLSADQQTAVNTVLAEAVSESGLLGEAFLLFGVTGAGKTEVYLKLTEAILAKGQTVMLLVPEIALTSHIAKRFIRWFGRDNLALWHSNLSAGEKADTWRRLARGELRILIGTRSAVFTPMPDLGLIMVDEEHDSSFKQDAPAPRYDVHTVVAELARRKKAHLLLGSATPDINTYDRARQAKRILYLKQRYGGRQLATTELVDMRRERSQGVKGPFSRRLQEALQANLAAGEQSIVFINRRGFYTVLSCTECQYVFQCPHCDVAMTVHKPTTTIQQTTLRCHYCAYQQALATFCPQCANMQLQQTGMGTQRAEDTLAELLPEARILRLDSDIMSQKTTHIQLFEQFARHEADILIGTQMVAKGLDIANVTLVGVLNADATFYLPDYKASERAFQLLTQVVGRAGRGQKPGRAIIQSYDPEHPVIQLAKAQDYEGFYTHELANRQRLGFPPFSQLFRFIASGPEEEKTRQFLHAAMLHLRKQLQQAGFSDDETAVSGPSPCVIPRIQARYRFQAILKNQKGPSVHQAITRFYQGAQPPASSSIHFLLDVNAQSLL